MLDLHNYCFSLTGDRGMTSGVLDGVGYYFSPPPLNGLRGEVMLRVTKLSPQERVCIVETDLEVRASGGGRVAGS